MEPILLIEFIKPQDFYEVIFENQRYKIVGKFDVGNLIGQDNTDTVSCLEEEPSNVRYIANNLEVFVAQLAQYKEYVEKSEADWEKWLAEFRESIMNLDANAFRDEENFWSVIVEQMEYGLL